LGIASVYFNAIETQVDGDQKAIYSGGRD